jgi:GT2 family glycosyltransferase
VADCKARRYGAAVGEPVVSVIVPTRNRPELLSRALASVQSQSHRPVELIVVDDASDTPIVPDVSGFDVEVVRRPEATGPSAARNAGVAAARGTYVCFVDDDDTLTPDALRQCVDRLQADPNMAAVAGWHGVVRPDGSRAVHRTPALARPKTLAWFDPIATPFALVNRRVAGDELCFDEALPACEDWDLWLRLSRLGRFELIPAPLYEYHQHAGPRVSRAGSSGVDGHRAFVAKHRAQMAPACVAFHEANVALLDGNQRGAVRAAAKDPRAAALFATLFVATKVGLRRADPGLPGRVAALVLR